MSSPYLAILIDKHLGGHQTPHAGLAVHGRGRTLCDDRPLCEFFLTARDPNFALYRPAGWRHRYAEAFLELNRGCPACLDILARFAADAGYTKPKGLSV